MQYDNTLAGDQLACLLQELGGWVSMENTFADDARAAAQADAALAQGFDSALFQNALGWLTSVSAAGQALGNARLEGALTWTNSIAGNLQTLADGFIDHALAEVNTGADALQTFAGSQGNSLLNWAAANGATGLVTTGGGTIGTNGSGGGVVAFGQPAGGNQGGLPWYNPLGWFQTNWDDAVNEELQIVQQLNRQFGTSHVSLGAFTPEERAAIEQALGRSFDWDNMPLQGAQEELENRDSTLGWSQGLLITAGVADAAAAGVMGWTVAGLPTYGVGVGPGAGSTGLHVIFGASENGVMAWKHAVGLGELWVIGAGSDIVEGVYFTLEGIPILSSAGVVTLNWGVINCGITAGYAFARGWMPWLP